jgi:hypothetical protein
MRFCGGNKNRNFRAGKEIFTCQPLGQRETEDEAKQFDHARAASALPNYSNDMLSRSRPISEYFNRISLYIFFCFCFYFRLIFRRVLCSFFLIQVPFTEPMPDHKFFTRRRRVVSVGNNYKIRSAQHTHTQLFFCFDFLFNPPLLFPPCITPQDHRFLSLTSLLLRPNVFRESFAHYVAKQMDVAPPLHFFIILSESEI